MKMKSNGIPKKMTGSRAFDRSGLRFERGPSIFAEPQSLLAARAVAVQGEADDDGLGAAS